MACLGASVTSKAFQQRLQGGRTSVALADAWGDAERGTDSVSHRGEFLAMVSRPS